MLKNWLFLLSQKLYQTTQTCSQFFASLSFFCFFFLPSVWETWRTLLGLIYMGSLCSAWNIKHVKISWKFKIQHNIFLWQSQHMLCSAAGELSPFPAVISILRLHWGCSFQLIVHSWDDPMTLVIPLTTWSWLFRAMQTWEHFPWAEFFQFQEQAGGAVQPLTVGKWGITGTLGDCTLWNGLSRFSLGKRAFLKHCPQAPPLWKKK